MGSPCVDVNPNRLPDLEGGFFILECNASGTQKMVPFLKQ